MKYIWTIILMLLLCSSVQGQDPWVGLTWDIGFPTGDMEEYIGETSFRGFRIDARYIMQPKLSMGLLWGWNTFHELSDALIEIENGAVSGHQNRAFYVSPIMASTHYYAIDYRRQRFVPFIGLNYGVYWISQVLEIGVLEIEDNDWHFGLAPEIGVAVLMDYDTYFRISGIYNNAFAGGDDISWFSLNVGFSYLP
jgi:hypothetical protein